MKKFYRLFIFLITSGIGIFGTLFAQNDGQLSSKNMASENRTGIISVKDYGARGDGRTDDTKAIQEACDRCIQDPQFCTTVRFPVGNYRISRPIILQNVHNGRFQFFTVRLLGDVSNKSASNEYLSRITCDYKAGFGLGIQLGRSIEIENLTILGKYTFPYSVSNKNIATLKFNDWIDPSITDSRYKPYAGISIDPFPGVDGSGGSSDISISHCAIKQWMVGVCLTPNPETANDEIINILEDDIEACRIAVSIGQDQSKTVNIKGLKVWASVHTILDGLIYGRGNGGGSVFCENWNIAGNVNQLFNLITDRFPLSCMNIYSESIFRIGSVGNGTGTNFINCQIDFLSGPGWPAADFLLLGSANFYGGSLRYYDNSFTHRMNFCNMNGIFRDMTLSTPPFIKGLYGMTPGYATPRFDNVHYYYRGGRDTLIQIAMKSIVIDTVKWTGTVTGDMSQVRVGDYILGSPGAHSRKYFENTQSCNTIQIGRVTSVSKNSVTVDDVGLNTPHIGAYDAIYISRLL